MRCVRSGPRAGTVGLVFAWIGEQYVKFQSGDAVQLKSGGPLMTVQDEVEDLLLCMWVSPTGRICRQTYAPRELQYAEASELVAVTAIKRLACRWVVAATL